MFLAARLLPILIFIAIPAVIAIVLIPRWQSEEGSLDQKHKALAGILISPVTLFILLFLAYLVVGFFWLI